MPATPRRLAIGDSGMGNVPRATLSGARERPQKQRQTSGIDRFHSSKTAQNIGKHFVLLRKHGTQIEQYASLVEARDDWWVR